MIATLFLILVFSVISLGIWFVSVGLGMKFSAEREKSSPFECGFDKIYSSRPSFSLQFFLVAIVFLVFDIEIALLIPLITTFMEWSPELIFMSGGFIIILVAGLIHEWREGTLVWRR